MNKYIVGILVLAFMGQPLAAQVEKGRAFKSFEVESGDVPGLKFSFSEADATSDSPVIIAVVGRKLTMEDHKYRVGLQKYWLSVNVAANLQIEQRVLGKCGLKREGEYPYCDIYQFVNPKTKERVSYYIYVGNWP